jgi:probable addiction module antidote protein
MSNRKSSGNSSEPIVTEEEMLASLNAAFEGNDLPSILKVLGDIARARGMTQIAQHTGLRRESLYKSLSMNGNPKFSVFLKVMNAVGLRLHVTSK